jgi:hypothetical protein
VLLSGVNEIRAVFAGAEAASTRMREFRADRTANIQNANALWPLCSNRVGVIHLLPLASFASGYSCEIDKIAQKIAPALYPMGKRPSISVPKFTFDGYANQMNWGAKGGALNGYSHLFRNGVIENVAAGLLDQSTMPPPAEIDAAHLHWLEVLIMECAERMLQIMELLEVPGPYYLLLAFLNVKGLRVTPGDRAHFRREIRTLDRENLILPEVVLDNIDVSIENEMRTSFDMIWNAFGWERSSSYDVAGEYDKDWRSFFR